MGGLSSLATVGLNLALSQEAYKRENKALDKERKRQVAAIQAQDAALAKDGADALKQRLASVRARAGAAGLSTSGGSIDAVMRGLEQEAADGLAAASDKASGRIEDLRESTAARKKRNLLELSNTWLDIGNSALGSGSSRRRSQ